MSKKKEKYYPKTRRVKDDDKRYIITEKLDGSNIGLGVLDGELIVFQRSKAYKYISGSAKDIKGLEGWLSDNKNELISMLDEHQVVFGEWLGTGRIKYPTLNYKYYVFACGQFDRVDDDYEVYNLTNSNQAIEKHCGDFIGPDGNNIGVSTCPLVAHAGVINVEMLDNLYVSYTDYVQRDVEGFVVYDKATNTVEKYVRYKNGKKSKHTS